MQEHKTALLVDDDDDFLFQQKSALEKLGFEVTTASGRQEAVEKLDSLKPDLAIVDLMMEEMDGGFVLAHQIRQRYPETRIIMVTAVTGETGLQFGEQPNGQRRWIKADAVLAKPVRFEQMKREIERVMT